jgi:hypothetical protein
VFTIICVTCGKEYKTRYKQLPFCCRECYDKAVEDESIDISNCRPFLDRKVCRNEECRTKFISVRSTRLYCCEDCKISYYYFKGMDRKLERR